MIDVILDGHCENKCEWNIDTSRESIFEKQWYK